MYKDKVHMQCRGGKRGFQGRMTVQLTDSRTGRIKQTFENNIGTVFHNDVMNAFNTLERAGNTSYFDTKSTVFENMFPITGGASMGIMLFSDTMPADKTYCSRPDCFTNLVGHAGDVYAGDSLFRGTYMPPESSAFYDNDGNPIGFRLVHTWLTGVGTGVINSVALTSQLGGNCLTGARIDSVTDMINSVSGFGAFNTDPANFNTDSRISAGSSYNTGSWKTVDFRIAPSIGTWALQTSRPLCFRRNYNQTVSIWLMAYNSDENALVLYRCDSPLMQGFNPFEIAVNIRNFTATEIWRMPTLTNIHASMFYFDGQHIRCTRCIDSSNAATVTFEDMKITLGGGDAGTQTYSFASPENFWGANITAATAASAANIMCKCVYVTASGNFLCTPYISTVNRGRTVVLNPNNGNVIWNYDFYLSTTANTMGSNDPARYKQLVNGALLLPGASNVTHTGSPYTANSFQSLIVHDKIQGCGYSGFGSSNGYNNLNVSPGANPPIIIPSTDNSAGVISADWRGTTAMNAPINIAFNSNYLATINNLEQTVHKEATDVLKTIYDIRFVA